MYHFESPTAIIPPFLFADIKSENSTGIVGKIVEPGWFRPWIYTGQTITDTKILFPDINYVWVVLIPFITLLNFIPYHKTINLKILTIVNITLIFLTLGITTIFLPIVLTLIAPYFLALFVTTGILVWIRTDFINGINFKHKNPNYIIKQIEIANSQLQTVITQSIWGVIIISLGGVSGIVTFVFQSGYFLNPITQAFARVQVMMLFLFFAMIISGVLYFITLTAYRKSIELRDKIGNIDDGKDPIP